MTVRVLIWNKQKAALGGYDVAKEFTTSNFGMVDFDSAGCNRAVMKLTRGKIEALQCYADSVTVYLSAGSKFELLGSFEEVAA